MGKFPIPVVEPTVSAINLCKWENFRVTDRKELNMDEYDVLLYEINREIEVRKLKKFFRGKKWTKKQRKEMEKQGKPPLEINRIKSGQEIQREQMRRNMGLTDSEGLTITEENLKKLMDDLSRVISVGGLIILGRMFYKDFSHFCSALMEKYFTKVKI